MKHLPTLLALAAVILLTSLWTTCNRIERLKTDLSTTAQELSVLRAANKAETIHEASVRIDTIRDTLYRTRTRTEIVWRDRISITPPDSVVYVRLDSCIQVGSIVLNELALCDSSNTLKDSAIASYRVAVAGMDSALIKTQANAVRMKKQRNWAIGAAVAGWLAFLVK